MFILREDTPNLDDDPQGCWQAYHAYVLSIADRLPPRVLEYALKPWTPSNEWYQYVHDAWIEELRIIETAAPNDIWDRQIDMELRLLGPNHDGYSIMKYLNVQSYSLTSPPDDWAGPISNTCHRDLVYDEIRLSERGYVLHELEFAARGNWLIECADMHYSWEPKPQAD